ncbi:MAG: DUF2124 domain-containing protein [Methanolobus sp.]|nr:DUF2124 domain-containing protein [Methanolobus sp.]
MKVLNSSQGIGGQLTDFRKLVESSERITFIGTAGFCTPFAELMAYVLRNSDKQMTFIPGLSFDDARSIVSTSHGMQLGDPVDPHADTIVLLGGLAMPKTGVELTQIKDLIDQVLENSEKKLIIGVCFQSVFEKMKWLESIDFDYIIDADLNNNLLEV